jgi:vancomycin aglycone glucosyltransferase
MRVAIAVEGTRGDVHPMLGLGGRLAARGHGVVVCAPPDFAEVVREQGFEFRPVGIAAREFLNECAGAVTRGGLAILRDTVRYMSQSLARQFETLPAATEGADLVIGAGVQGGASSAAQLHGVPYRYVVYCPAFFPSREHPPFMLPVQRFPRWSWRALWWVVDRIQETLLRRDINALRATLGLAPIGHAFSHLIGERPLLAADPALAPAPADLGFAVEQIPCLHPRDTTPLPPKLEAFLDGGPPPVYLGFGSMTDPEPDETTHKLIDAARRLGCRAIVSQGWAGLGDGPIPDGVHVTGPVSHELLFPRCAAVVHHGGAGTTTTAARAGVPQLVVPHLFDQFYWADRVRALGLGPGDLPRRRLDVHALVALLGATLGNEVLEERCREFGARLRDEAAAAPDPAELCESVVASPRRSA